MSIRGARAQGSRVVTSAYTGVFARSRVLRAEFLRSGGAPARAAGK